MEIGFIDFGGYGLWVFQLNIYSFVVYSLEFGGYGVYVVKAYEFGFINVEFMVLRFR